MIQQMTYEIQAEIKSTLIFTLKNWSVVFPTERPEGSIASTYEGSSANVWAQLKLSAHWQCARRFTVPTARVQAGFDIYMFSGQCHRALSVD